MVEIQIAVSETSGAVPDVRPAFEAFFLRTRDRLAGSLWLVTRNRHDTEEVAQEAYVRVWQRWDRVGQMDDPEGYLVRTAINVWRGRGRRAAVALRKAIHAIPPEDALAEIDSRDAVVRALAALTPRQRAAVVLMDLLDLTSEDAARALGVRASTVRVLAAKGRARLREGMER
jgi:RNA polymerase sigma-70 factor (ECF subfamily)